MRSPRKCYAQKSVSLRRAELGVVLLPELFGRFAVDLLQRLHGPEMFEAVVRLQVQAKGLQRHSLQRRQVGHSRETDGEGLQRKALQRRQVRDSAALAE